MIFAYIYNIYNSSDDENDAIFNGLKSTAQVYDIELKPFNEGMSQFDEIFENVDGVISNVTNIENGEYVTSTNQVHTIEINSALSKKLPIVYVCNIKCSIMNHKLPQSAYVDVIPNDDERIYEGILLKLMRKIAIKYKTARFKQLPVDVTFSNIWKEFEMITTSSSQEWKVFNGLIRHQPTQLYYTECYLTSVSSGGTVDRSKLSRVEDELITLLRSESVTHMEIYLTRGPNRKVLPPGTPCTVAFLELVQCYCSQYLPPT